MVIKLSSNIDMPIYEQIESQIKSLILSGEAKAGDPIPPMRNLASDLGISLITVQKAYEKLKRDGFIETSVGRGSYVREINSSFVQEEMLRRIEDHISKAVELARSSGIDKQTLSDIMGLYFEE